MARHDRGAHRSDRVPLAARLARWLRGAPEVASVPVQAAVSAQRRPTVYARHDGDIIVGVRNEVRVVPRRPADTRTDLPVVPGFMRRMAAL